MESRFKLILNMEPSQPQLFTCLSPSLLNLYEVDKSIVVIIDVLRATSTIATALHNGAKAIIPVDSVAECIRIGKHIDSITAGERDGKIAEGLDYGNSPFEYPREFIEGKTLNTLKTDFNLLLKRTPSEITTFNNKLQQIISKLFSHTCLSSPDTTPL